MMHGTARTAGLYWRRDRLFPMLVPPATAFGVFLALSAALHHGTPNARSAADFLVDNTARITVRPLAKPHAAAATVTVPPSVPAVVALPDWAQRVELSPPAAIHIARRLAAALPASSGAAPKSSVVVVSTLARRMLAAAAAVFERGAAATASRLTEAVVVPPSIVSQPVEVPVPPPRPLPLVITPGTPRTPAGLASYDHLTAVYEIASHTVYLPNGSRLEAHSGLGVRMDDPNGVRERMRGATPPNIYEIRPLDKPFHGVRALRLNPVGDGNMFGRDGILAHTYMLGPRGDSNGCVVFKDYRAFLEAFDSGAIKHLAVVTRLN